MIYLTSDWHQSDTRHNFLGRPFSSAEEMNNTILKNYLSIVQPQDTVYFLGDIFGPNGGDPSFLGDLPGNKHLILGDYEAGPKAHPEILTKLIKYFQTVGYNDVLTHGNNEKIYLTHKPEDARKDMFNLVGHCHASWRIQRNMINVGIDAWHFRPVSLERILHIRELIRSTYDQNIFAGELDANNH